MTLTENCEIVKKLPSDFVVVVVVGVVVLVVVVVVLTEKFNKKIMPKHTQEAPCRI